MPIAEQGLLEDSLRRLVCAFYVRQFHEELIANVLHPTKIEQRLLRGLTIDEAF